METTGSGLKKPECQDIEPIQINIDILDQHLRDTDIHVNAGKIADITEPDELSQIDSTDTNSTMWGKIKKSISVLDNHVDTVASETILGHVKIGTGLQAEKDGTTSVKVANNLETVDSTISLSAAMGVQLSSDLDKTNTHLVQHIGEIASSDKLGHIKIGNGLQTTADGTTSLKIANNLTTDDSVTVLSAAMGKSLNEILKGKAQTNHASSGTEYGMGNASQYGHVKLSDSYTSSAGTAANGVGASSKAVADAYSKLNTNLVKVLIKQYSVTTGSSEQYEIASTLVKNAVGTYNLSTDASLNNLSIQVCIPLKATNYNSIKRGFLESHENGKGFDVFGPANTLFTVFVAILYK